MNGSIQHRPDRPKPWRARYRGGDGRQHSRAFARKVEAEKWLRAELARLDQGSWVDPTAGAVQFGDYSQSWLAGLHDVKPKTRAGYESLLRSRVLPDFAGAKLSGITPEAVRGWVAAMAGEGLSAARIRQARQVLHAVLEQAVADGRLVRNPVDRVKAPTVRPRRQNFLTAEQVAALADAAEARQPGAGVLLRFLAYSGLRWGEAVALRVGAVSVERRRVRVRESATEVGGKLIFGAPKTHETRVVIVPGFVMDRLARRLDGKPPETLVFTAPQGGPLRVSNFRRSVWQPAVAAAGLPADLVPHDLRDTAASLMISAGASIKAVQRALGHASAKMTLDTYGSLFEDDLEQLADRLEERFAQADVAQTWPKTAEILHFPR